MGFLSKFLGWDTSQEKVKREEKDRRETEGFTTWHPEYGDVYYPPTRLAYLNEYNRYSSNEPDFGYDDSFYT